MLSNTDKETILSHIKIVDDCWIWGMRVNTRGRGIYALDRTVDGKRKVTTYQIHRVLYEEKYGKLDVRYLDNTCGNLRCCNPEHHCPRTLEVRFWGNIKKKDGCWIWQGTKFDTGYGSITIDGDSHLAHRLAFELHYKKLIPKGKMVLHSCHNKDCINPEHLRIGTHVDNMRDMVVANRQARGEEDGNAKLSVSEVRKIKGLLGSGEFTHKQIAGMFKVGRSTVTDIRKGRTWSWL